jgi:hypothetical protein
MVEDWKRRSYEPLLEYTGPGLTARISAGLEDLTEDLDPVIAAIVEKLLGYSGRSGPNFRPGRVPGLFGSPVYLENSFLNLCQKPPLSR